MAKFFISGVIWLNVQLVLLYQPAMLTKSHASSQTGSCFGEVPLLSHQAPLPLPSDIQSRSSGQDETKAKTSHDHLTSPEKIRAGRPGEGNILIGAGMDPTGTARHATPRSKGPGVGSARTAMTRRGAECRHAAPRSRAPLGWDLLGAGGRGGDDGRLARRRRPCRRRQEGGHSRTDPSRAAM